MAAVADGCPRSPIGKRSPFRKHRSGNSFHPLKLPGAPIVRAGYVASCALLRCVMTTQTAHARPTPRDVRVVDLRRGETVGLLKVTSGVEEVFAVALVPRRFPT